MNEVAWLKQVLADAKDSKQEWPEWAKQSSPMKSMNFRTHQIYATKDLWVALKHIADAKGSNVEREADAMLWAAIGRDWPELVDHTNSLNEYTRKAEAELSRKLSDKLQAALKAKL